MQFFPLNKDSNKMGLFIPDDITREIMSFFSCPKTKYNKVMRQLENSEFVSSKNGFVMDGGTVQMQIVFCECCGEYEICHSYETIPYNVGCKRYNVINFNLPGFFRVQLNEEDFILMNDALE